MVDLEQKSILAEAFLDRVATKDDEITIKSKARVAEHGEVFTPRNIVRDMLNLEGVNELSYKLDSTFLEPSCGNGNFLIQILVRKLMVVNVDNIDIDVAKALCSIYGVDIQQDNVEESRDRMLNAVKQFYSENDKELSKEMLDAFTYILYRNIILGNTLDSTQTGEAVKPRDRIKKKFVDSRVKSGESVPMEITEWHISDDGMVTRKDIQMKLIQGDKDNDDSEYDAHYDEVHLTELSKQIDKIDSVF